MINKIPLLKTFTAINLVLIFLIIWMIIEIKFMQKSNNFYAISGLVVLSNVYLSPNRLASEKNKRRNEVNVEFEFKIDGKIYSGNNIGDLSFENAKNRYGSIKNGDPITVFYDKDNPKRSTLNPGFASNAIVYLMIYVILFIILNFVWIRAILNNAQQDDAPERFAPGDL